MENIFKKIISLRWLFIILILSMLVFFSIMAGNISIDNSLEIWFLEDIAYYEEQLEEWNRNIEAEDKEDIILRKARGDIEERSLEERD